MTHPSSSIGKKQRTYRGHTVLKGQGMIEDQLISKRETAGFLEYFGNFLALLKCNKNKRIGDNYYEILITISTAQNSVYILIYLYICNYIEYCWR